RSARACSPPARRRRRRSRERRGEPFDTGGRCRFSLCVFHTNGADDDGHPMPFARGVALPADQTTVRHANLGVVLRHVASSRSRSRAQIAAETGLTRGTVSSLVSELIARDLLHETGETTSPRGIGRPGAALELSDVVVGVGLEVNVDYLAVSVEDLTGSVRYRRRSNRDNRD